MPPKRSRSQQQHRRNLRQSARIATKAMRSVIKDVGPQAAHIKSRVVIKQEPIRSDIPSAIAFASNPVTFGVERPTGKLLASKYGGALRTARHEVAHLLQVPDQAYVGHLSIRATKAEESTLGVLHARRIEKSSIGGKFKRIRRHSGGVGYPPARQSGVPTPIRGLLPGATKGIVPGGSTKSPITHFNTGISRHLKRVSIIGRPHQRKKARSLERKLERRLKGRVDM